MKKTLMCFWDALVRTINQDGVEHAGYMSFMVLLSIFPFIVFFLALTSFFGASELGTNFVNLLLNTLPEDATLALRHRIFELVKSPPYKLMTIAIIGTIWTSSSFVEGLRTILNRVYNISSPPPYLFRRLLSIVQFLVINLMLSIVMLLLVIIPIGIRKIPELVYILDTYTPLWNYSRYVLILISLFTTVSALYYIIPNIQLEFKKIIPGSVVTVLLWIASGNILSSYLVYYNQLSVLYGSLGSIIVTLLFFYIFNMIFIYGAELNYLLEEAYKKDK